MVHIKLKEAMTNGTHSRFRGLGITPRLKVDAYAVDRRSHINLGGGMDTGDSHLFEYYRCGLEPTTEPLALV